MDIVGLISSIAEKSTMVLMIVIAAGIIGVVQLLMQITMAINNQFTQSRTVMQNQVSEFGTALAGARQEFKIGLAAVSQALTQVAFALVAYETDKDRKELLVKAVDHLQEKESEQK